MQPIGITTGHLPAGSVQYSVVLEYCNTLHCTALRLQLYKFSMTILATSIDMNAL